MSPKHKLSVYYDEINKYRGHGMNAGDDPRTASKIWTSPMYNSSATKYTGTLSSRLLVEAGFSFNYEQYVIVQSEAALRHLASTHPYDTFSDEEAETLTLRAGAERVNAVLEEELGERRAPPASA